MASSSKKFGSTKKLAKTSHFWGNLCKTFKIQWRNYHELIDYPHLFITRTLLSSVLYVLSAKDVAIYALCAFLGVKSGLTILVRVKDLTFCNSDHCSQSSANQNYIDFSPSIGPLQWCNCFLFVLFVYFRDKMSKSISLNAVEAQNAIVSDHFSRVALSGPSPYDTNSHIFCILKTNPI